MANTQTDFFISPLIKNFTLVYHEEEYNLWFEDNIVKTIEDVNKPIKRQTNKLYDTTFSKFINKDIKLPKEYYEIHEAITNNAKRGDDCFYIFKDLFITLMDKDKKMENLLNASDKIKNTYTKSNLKTQSSKGTLDATTKVLKENYEKSIENINNKETKTLYIDCDILKKYYVIYDDIDDNGENIKETLYSLLENKPNDTIETFKTSLELLLNEDIKEYYIKFDYNGNETRIDELLSDKLGRLIKTTGIIKGIYEIKPYLKTGVFECRGCMKIHEVEAASGDIIEPSLCDICGGRSFRLLEEKSTYYNARKLLIEEPIEEIGNKTNPRNLIMITTGEGKFVNKLNIGDRVNITGILSNYRDDKTGEFNFYINCNNIDVIGDVAINISEEEEKQIIELSKEENILQKLTKSIAPQLYLDDEIKQAMLYSVVGGGIVKDGRSEIHTLIISNPGYSKSDLFEWTGSVSEKCIMTSGANSSGVGLTGAIDKDPVTGQNVLKAGALVLASNGICVGDELDKLNKNAFGKLNMMLEHGYENFNKGGINETLYCNSTFIGGANPKYERFTKYKSLKEQITFPASFLSRMDNIFICMDDPSEEIFDLILNRFTDEDEAEDNVDTDIISKDLLKKYLYYAKHNFKPVLSEKAKQKSKAYIRDVLYFFEECDKNGEEIIEFTLSRFINSVARVGGAIAKLHLRNEILVEDIEQVIKLKNHCFKLMGYDIPNGTVEEEIVKGEVKSDKRFQYQTIFDIITGEKEKEESVYMNGYGLAKSYIKTRFNELTGLSDKTCDKIIKYLYDDDKLSKRKYGIYSYYDIQNKDKWSESIL